MNKYIAYCRKSTDEKDKQVLSIEAQIADLVLYPTYDAIIPFHNTRTDHFISFENYLKKKLLDKTSNLIP